MIKKYFIFLPLIASCSGVRQANNFNEPEELNKQAAGLGNVDQTSTDNKKPNLIDPVSDNNIELVGKLLKEGVGQDLPDKHKSSDVYKNNIWYCIKKAVDMGFIKIADLLLDNVDDINKKNYSGTPLHVAAEHNDTTMACLLIKHGAKVNKVYREDESEKTPLDIAIEKNHINMVRCLLRQGAKLSETNLHEAISEGSLEIVCLLIKKGADVNAKAWYSQITPLFLAVKKNNINIVRILLQHGADASIRNKKGATPLDKAIKKNNMDIACLLKKFNR